MLTKLVLVALGVAGVIPMVSDMDLNGTPVFGLAAPTILGIFFIMWMRGDIVSGKVHRERVEDYKEEAKAWRDAHQVSEQARLTALNQVDALVEGFRTVDAIAQGIRTAAREG